MFKNPIENLRAEFDDFIDDLLIDRSTGDNIVWATDERRNNPIDKSYVDLIEPRFMKTKQRRIKRTKNRAEVFTPPEVCKLQNDLIVEPWNERPLEEFIDAKFLEIACGEAPYLVSRYNVVDGTPIKLNERIGLLDRKLKLINQHANAPNEWYELARRAYQSIYGYEFQGDNLLIARANLFLSAHEFFQAKFPNNELHYNFLKQLTNIISWNLWQFDGIKEIIPYQENNSGVFNNCKIKDWTHNGKEINFPGEVGGDEKYQT